MYRRWITVLVCIQSSHAVVLVLYNVAIGKRRMRCDGVERGRVSLVSGSLSVRVAVDILLPLLCHGQVRSGGTDQDKDRPVSPLHMANDHQLR